MRRIWFAPVLLAASVVHANPKAPAAPPAPDLVFRWEEGEMSRDMSIWRTEITVTGDKLHYERKYSGRLPMGEPVTLDATVKDPKKVAAALAALDKIKVKKAKPLNETERMNMRSGCIRRKAKERCAEATGQNADPPDLKAIAAVRDALLEGVKVPGQL